MAIHTRATQDALKGFSTKTTPQSQPAGAATVKNAAGGHVFAIDDMARLRRFLTLGTSGGTYYTKAQDLTRDNAEVIVKLAHENPTALVDEIAAVSTAGRAPKQNPAIFALALCAAEADVPGRRYALAALPRVCRTGTHMYLFAGYVEQFRGWGRGLKHAVADWYNSRDVDKLAYQIVKYRQREGWRHADLLALSHPEPQDPVRDALYRWVVDVMTGTRDAERIDFVTRSHREHYRTWVAEGGPGSSELTLPELVDAFVEVQSATALQAVNLIAAHDLSWEMLPDRLVTEALVWEALIHKGLPQTALMRQLPRLTNMGLTTGKTGAVIAGQLCSPEKLRQGRVHPINVLVAARTYAAGRSARGDATWTPLPNITGALDSAFYAAYGAVEPSGKSMLLACDVSGSMGSPAGGLPISCREACAALSLVSLNVEKNADIIGFSDGRGHGGNLWGFHSSANSMATRLDISARRRLDDVCTYMAGLNFGRTDCALPMLWAMKNKLDFDAIWTLTDNETWYGQIHPWQALKAYRDHVGHDVKYGVIAMTATGTSIADPDDASSMDVAGFDTTVPQVMSDFSAGKI
jgi:60 kDa SS-A/Ro ribonucleoprotein